MALNTVAFFDVTQLDREQLGRLVKNIPDVEAHFFAEELDIQTAAKAAEAEIVSIFINSEVLPEVLAKLPKLKHLVCRSTGFNNIDLDTAKARGISVSNVPSYGEYTVAEYTFGLLLALSRKIPLALEAARKGSIEHQGLTGFDLHGKTLGVIGTGHIGQQVAKIGKGFGMEVIACDLKQNSAAAASLGFTYTSQDELLTSADIISLHTPYLKSTHHLLNKAAFTQMKRGVHVVNTARGELVDTAALIAALQAGKVAGAALDVLESEELLDVHEELVLLRPDISKAKLMLAAEHAILQKMPNVILSNHNAFNSAEAVGRINASVVENIKNWLSGQPGNLVS